MLLCNTFWSNILVVLKLSMSNFYVSKPNFLYLEYILSLFCIAEIINVSNQGFKFAFSFLFGATELIALINLIVKQKYVAIVSCFTQAYFK